MFIILSFFKYVWQYKETKKEKQKEKHIQQRRYDKYRLVNSRYFRKVKKTCTKDF